MNLTDWLQTADLVRDLDPLAGIGVIVSTAIAFGAIVMQFLALLRHQGEEAVVSSLTWLLLASFSVAMGAYFWREFSDFFLVLLMGLLALGALAGYLLNLSKREMLERVRRARALAQASRSEMTDAAISLRLKLQRARQTRRNHAA
jgi:uncharacterized membrane protein YfcA